MSATSIVQNVTIGGTLTITGSDAIVTGVHIGPESSRER